VDARESFFIRLSSLEKLFVLREAGFTGTVKRSSDLERSESSFRRLGFVSPSLAAILLS
jgi:hypothetical protein